MPETSWENRTGLLSSRQHFRSGIWGFSLKTIVNSLQSTSCPRPKATLIQYRNSEVPTINVVFPDHKGLVTSNHHFFSSGWNLSFLPWQIDHRSPKAVFANLLSSRKNGSSISNVFWLSSWYFMYPKVFQLNSVKIHQNYFENHLSFPMYSRQNHLKSRKSPKIT